MLLLLTIEHFKNLMLASKKVHMSKSPNLVLPREMKRKRSLHRP